MRVEEKLEGMGLALPGETRVPADMDLPFSWVRMRGNRAYVSGHGPLSPDGSPAPPFGKVGAEVSAEEGYEAARKTALSMLGSLKREVGDLDRIVWLVVNGMVNVAPGFTATPSVINGFSDLILELYGHEAGAHARTAVGVAMVPLGLPVVISAEVEVST